MSGDKPVVRRPYPAEFRERAVRLVLDHHGEYPTQWKAIESIAAKLGVNHERYDSGCAGPRPTPASAQDSQPMSEPGSNSWRKRTKSCAGQTKYSKLQRLSSGRSSTASHRNSGVHRRLLTIPA